jgi:hypothetical protein
VSNEDESNEKWHSGQRTVFCALKAGVTGAKAAAEPTNKAATAVLNIIFSS